MSTSELPALDIAYQDDAHVLREATTEDFAGHAAPESWRAGRGALAMAWLGFPTAIFWMVVPAGLTLAVGTKAVLIGLAVSAVLVAFGAYFVIPWATATGLPVSVFSRRMFGYFGAACATLVLAATGIYFAAFEGSVIGVAFHQYFGGLSLNLWYLVVVLIAAPLVIGGVRVWLDRLNGVLLPLYLLGLIGAIVWAIAEYGYHGGWLSFKPPHPLDTHGPAWIFVMSTYIAQPTLLFAWEYARLGRSQDVQVNRRITFGLPFWLATFFVNGVIGIFLVNTIPHKGELSEVSLVLAIVALMGLAGVGFIWVTQTRINTANFYVASTNLQAFAARILKFELPRAVWVIGAGAIVYALMLANLFSFLLEALRYQGAFVTGWLTILVAHVIVARRQGEDPRLVEFRPGRLPQINPVGFVPWVVAGALGTVLLATEKPWVNTWALPIDAVTALGLYLVARLIARPSWERMTRPNDPREAVEDPWSARIRCGSCGDHYLASEMDRDPSNGQQPICAACAAKSVRLYGAAYREARALGGRTPTGPGAGQPADSVA
jgi:cytosine/uracil/thiamine/allantoin permease